MTLADTAPPGTSTAATPALLPQLVYIMGTARSGSTILEILLGNSPGCLNVGELTHVLADGFVRGDPCSCGRPAGSCELWGEVRRRCGWTDWDVRQFARVTREVDWHPGFVRAWLGWWPHSTWARYRDGWSVLLQAVEAVSRASVLAESSLYPARALALWRLLGPRLKVLCLTRDPVGLLASFTKPHQDEQLPKTTWQLFCYVVAVEAAARLAAWRIGRAQVLVVRFEDLATDPEATLARIGRWVGVDMRRPIELVRERAGLSPGHIVTGNRVRKEPRIVFQPAPPAPAPAGVIVRAAVVVMRLWRRLLGFA